MEPHQIEIDGELRTVVCKVAGVSFQNEDGSSRQAAIPKTGRPEQAGITLEREPGNEHDANAVKVLARGRQIGYVPRDAAEGVAAALDAGKTVTASLRSVGRAAGRRALWGVEIGVTIRG